MASTAERFGSKAKRAAPKKRADAYGATVKPRKSATPNTDAYLGRMSDQERTLRAQIANGGQSLGMVPTALDVVNDGSPYAKPGPYTTTLSPSQEVEFQRWKAINAPNDSGQDYDLRGAFLANTGRAGNGHMTDQFKMPNHHSFSNESQYATPDAPRWNQKGQLVDKYGNVVFDERNGPQTIGEGGQSLGLTFRDPTRGIIEADPFEMATGMPLTDGNENYDKLTRTALGAVQGIATPAYLQPGYQGPQTGMGPVGDFASGLGQVFQGGTGAGSMGAPALLASHAVNNAADAGHALGTMGGGRAFGGKLSIGGHAAEEVAMGAAEIESLGRKFARDFKDPAKVDTYIAALGMDDPRIQKMMPALQHAKSLLTKGGDVAMTPKEIAAEKSAAAELAHDQRIMDRGTGDTSSVEADPMITKMLRGIRDPQS